MYNLALHAYVYIILSHYLLDNGCKVDFSHRISLSNFMNDLINILVSINHYYLPTFDFPRQPFFDYLGHKLLPLINRVFL